MPGVIYWDCPDEGGVAASMITSSAGGREPGPAAGIWSRRCLMLVLLVVNDEQIVAEASRDQTDGDSAENLV